MNKNEFDTDNKRLRIKKIKERAKEKMTLLKESKKTGFSKLADKATSYMRKGLLYVSTFIVTGGPNNAQANTFAHNRDDNGKRIENHIPAPVNDINETNSIHYNDAVNKFDAEKVKEEIISNHLAGTIQYSLNAYDAVKKGGMNVVKREYRDTYVQTKGKYYYCLRPHTKAFQDYQKDNNLAYFDNIFKGLPNLAGCPRFLDDLIKRFPDDVYGNKYTAPRSGKVSYSMQKLDPAKIKAGDIVYLQSSVNSNSGMHAVRAVGHEYNKDGRITSAIAVSLNGQSFRRIGTKGDYSTVMYEGYENERVITHASIKGLSIHMGDMMSEALEMDIEKQYTENMSQAEKDEIREKVLAEYKDNIKENNEYAALYNKTGSEIVAALTSSDNSNNHGPLLASINAEEIRKVEPPKSSVIPGIHSKLASSTQADKDPVNKSSSTIKSKEEKVQPQVRKEEDNVNLIRAEKVRETQAKETKVTTKRSTNKDIEKRKAEWIKQAIAIKQKKASRS